MVKYIMRFNTPSVNIQIAHICGMIDVGNNMMTLYWMREKEKYVWRTLM